MDLEQQVRLVIEKEREVITHNLILYGRLRKIYDQALAELESAGDVLLVRRGLVERVERENQRYDQQFMASTKK